MDNNINNPVKETDRIFGLNRTLFLIIVLLVCILSICVGIYAQFFYKYSESDPYMFGFVTKQKEEEEKEKLITDFENIFTNEYKVSTANINANKISDENDIVYTAVNEEAKEELYEINANIPNINLDTDCAKNINDDIKEEFENTIATIKGSTTGYKVYTVTYIAFSNEDILSIAIKSTYYEQNAGSQITNIKTYNYNLQANSEVDLATVMTAKGLNTSAVQNEINSKIKQLIESDAELEYSTIQRDLDSGIYEIESTNTFLVTTEGDIYLIYNYGTKQDVLVY